MLLLCLSLVPAASHEPSSRSQIKRSDFLISSHPLSDERDFRYHCPISVLWNNYAGSCHTRIIALSLSVLTPKLANHSSVGIHLSLYIPSIVSLTGGVIVGVLSAMADHTILARPLPNRYTISGKVYQFLPWTMHTMRSKIVTTSMVVGNQKIATSHRIVHTMKNASTVGIYSTRLLF